MKAGHPRDADPSITGQSHQVAGEVPGLMGKFRARMVTRLTCQRRYRSSTGTAATHVRHKGDEADRGRRRAGPAAAGQAAPR